jgi:hypothetical protein
MVWSVVVAALLYWGVHVHLERYITPQRGVGYWLGIVGGSMMVLLLLYSARKRVSWLRWMGGIPAWFEFHMVLGVAGPVLILFHCNFHLGATNSNVALICMLLVAGSGVIGRYIYTRLHARMGGHERTLEQLRAVGERTRAQNAAISSLPGLLDSVEAIERPWIDPPPGKGAQLWRLMTGVIRIVLARRALRREIRRAVRCALLAPSPVSGAEARRFGEAAWNHASRRLDAGRRVAEFKLYSQLFSLWHVLHIPLFFMLLIAGIVHVVAVNLY